MLLVNMVNEKTMKAIKNSIIFLIALLFAISAQATHITVAPATCYLLGTAAPYNALHGGDTLFFTTGTKAYIYLENFTGLSTAPIVVINQGGVVNCGRSYTYGIKIGGCRYIKFTGTGTSDKYGFHITAPSGDGVSIGDLSSDIELSNVRMDTCLLRGIVAKTDAACGGYAYRKNFTQYNTIIHDCYINKTVNEGMYIGSSFYGGETFTCSGVDSTIYPSVLNNCQVFNNIVNYAGFDGIQIASVPVGLSIHDNLVMYNSTSGTYDQRSGILIGGGDQGNCYNNYIYMGEGDGIENLGLGGEKIYNNVIIGAGTGYYPGNLSYPVHGIYNNDNSAVQGSEDDLMFNVIINPKTDGIDWQSSKKTASCIADNAIINPGVSGDYITNGGTLDSITNNYENAAIANAKFTDTTYKTNAGSPLIDAGWSNGKGITTDKFGNLRPQGITYDIGVYETPANSGIPTVITDTVTAITQTTATSGGHVISDGGAAVTVRGVCWNTSQNPTISNSYTTDGSGTGAFVSDITGLTANTLYYIRAYATNANGTAYGNQRSFTTLQNTTLATVTTDTVTAITQISATSGGNVTSDGGAAVTVRGVCWNTSQNPTISNSYITDGSGTGAFVSDITGLTANTLYYIRAYATNANGTAYGNQRSFTTLQNTTLATVTTDTVTAITQTTATSGGNVTSDGGAAVTVRGVCWNTSQNPTISNSYTTDGSGTGAFVSDITGLTANTLYYIRAYATNANGTAYGNQRNFTTLQNSTLPTVTTDTVTAITQISATSGGNVTSDGGAAVTVRGVCWNTSQNPKISNSFTQDGSGTGKFTSHITGLKINTLYYVRAYATNINGTAYGNQQNFTTLQFPVGDESTDTISKSSTLELYPDPVRSTLTIAFYLSGNSNINLSVYAVNGIKVYNEQFNDQSSGAQKMQLNTSSFIEGLYTVVITTDKMVITKNFIKLN